MDKAEVIERSLNIPGWMNEAELVWLYDTASQMETVIEIGSWQGRSTKTICAACPGPVYAIDSWQPKDDNLDLIIRAGHPIPQFFEENLAEELASGKLTLIKQNSHLAANNPVLPQKADMVFLDGDHTLIWVRRDLHNWSHRARKILCGHDYAKDHPHHPAVYQAVNERFNGRTQVAPGGTIWYVPFMMGVSH